MIWVDLDKTLVYVRNEGEDRTLAMLAPFWGISADVIPRPSRKGRRRLRSVKVRGVEFRGCLRCCAHNFLQTLRQLAEVRMLTSARRHYAIAMNAAFELGFRNTQILAREDWMDVQKNARTLEPVHGIDPDGVLIDNATDDWHHRQKLGYLGARGRLVTVADFTGFMQDSFAEKWPQHVRQVRDLLRETGAETLAYLHAEADSLLSSSRSQVPKFQPQRTLRK